MDASVIIPTFNRLDALSETLSALERVDYPAERWEVVIVDDGSTDDTQTAIASRISSSPIQIKFLKQQNSGPAAARNYGAREARGATLVFIDNDILVSPDFIRRHLESLNANPGCWVMGRVTHPDAIRETPFGRYRDRVWERFYQINSSKYLVETTGLTAANLSLPSADFQRLGGFDEAFTIASCEDCDLGIRARKEGIRVLYDSGNVVIHNDWALSLEKFCERQRLYSVSDALLWRKYGNDSPRRDLVHQNAPINWGADSSVLILKKTIKSLLATMPCRALSRTLCKTIERIAPDSSLSNRAYELCVGIAIFRGVREGLVRYENKTNMSRRGRLADRHTVIHLIDANLDTSYFRSIARKHDSKRYPVTIGSLVSTGPLQKAMSDIGVGTFSINCSKRRQYPLAMIRLARMLRTNRPAILHAHCFDATFVGLLSARLAGVPFVFTRHHSDHNVRLGKKWHTRIDSWCARHADRVIAVSEATRQVMKEVEGVPDAQISVVYNGMDQLKQPTVAAIEKTRASLGISNEIIVLMLGRLHEEKGHKVLFDSIPDVRARVGNCLFLLAGDGPDRAPLEDEARQRGLEDSVRFLGRRDDVAELISLSKLVVLPSLAESFGFVVVEAMSLGRPVVAAATGGVPEIIENGVNGILVPQKDSGALARGMLSVLQDPALEARFAQKGRETADRFSFEPMIRGYESVYAEVTSRTSTKRNENQPAREHARSKSIAG